MITAATYDPGGEADNFGMLTGQLTTREILLTDAISWSRKKNPNFSYDRVMKKNSEIPSALQV